MLARFLFKKIFYPLGGIQARMSNMIIQPVYKKDTKGTQFRVVFLWRPLEALMLFSP